MKQGFRPKSLVKYFLVGTVGLISSVLKADDINESNAIFDMSFEELLNTKVSVASLFTETELDVGATVESLEQAQTGSECEHGGTP